jgi:hypothetical protein
MCAIVNEEAVWEMMECEDIRRWRFLRCLIAEPKSKIIKRLQTQFHSTLHNPGVSLTNSRLNQELRIHLQFLIPYLMIEIMTLSIVKPNHLFKYRKIVKETTKPNKKIY